MARRIRLIPLLHVMVGVALAGLVFAWQSSDGDPVGLFQIIEHAAHGAVAYRDYPIEYPPLGLAALGIPWVLGGTTAPHYQTLFSAMALAFAVATGAAVLWLARRGWSHCDATDSVLLYTGLSLAVTPLVIWRFDIVPAFLTAVALVAYAARRSGWSGLTLGMGIVAKVYPGVLIPVFAAAMLFERRWREIVVLGIAASVVIAAVLAEVFLVGGDRVFYFLVYQRNRGTEIESLSGGLALLAGAFQNVPTKISFQFGSMQVSSTFLNALAKPELIFEVVCGLALAAALLFSFWRDVRDTGAVRPKTVVQYVLATLLLVILANKVLSPQYVVWLLPFVPLVGYRKSLLFLVICVLTTFEYPLLFGGLEKVQALPVVILNVRNVLLVALFAWTVWPARSQNDATFEIPPSTPAATPKMSNP